MVVTIDQKQAATQAPQITPNIMTPPTLGYSYLWPDIIVQAGPNANAFLAEGVKLSELISVT